MQLDIVSHWLELAVLISTAFVAYRGPRLFRWVKQKVKGLFAALRAIGELAHIMPHLHKLAGMEATLGTIRAQVMPNGGSSLNDKMTRALGMCERTEHAVTLLSATVRAHYDGDPVVAKFEANMAGGFTWASRSLLRWCNTGLEQMVGMGWTNCIAEHDRDRVRDEWESAVAERREFHLRFALRNHDGREFLVDASATPVFNGPGVEQWVGVFTRVAPPA